MKKIALAIFTVQEYLRGTWFFAEVLFTAIMLFLHSDGYWDLKANEVFLSLGIFAIVIASLTTFRVTNRETNQRIYIILTKAITRRDYVLGKIIAILLINSLFLLIVFFIGYEVTKLGTQYSFFEALGRLGLIILVALLTQMIALCFSPLIKAKSAFPIGLGLIILGFYQPMEALNFVLPPIQQLIKASYKPLNNNLILPMVLMGFYLVIFYFLTTRFFEQRELDYEPK